MEEIEKTVIPQSHIDFANEVADLADKNGVEIFVLEYDPTNETNFNWKSRINGTVKVNFSSKDGRGRPSRNLSVVFEQKVVHSICNEPNSFD